MDIHYSFNEKIIIVPRNYQINFKVEKSLNKHYLIYGSGTSINNYPLLCDGANEKGLAFAGLNFLGNAKYYSYKKGKSNYTPYELVLYLLGTCTNVDEVKMKLKDINILNVAFSEKIPLASLHFMISDLNKSIVIETTKEGMKIYDNPYNVLTNNPDFSFHKNNIYNYMHLSINDPINQFKEVELVPISFNQGLIGLPGDYSSVSRFIKAFVIKNYISLFDEENKMINQFFYVLDSVLMPKGLVKVNDEYEYTRYSICYNLNDQLIYYKTYDKRKIKSINIDKYDNSGESLIEI